MGNFIKDMKNRDNRAKRAKTETDKLKDKNEALKKEPVKKEAEVKQD